MVEIKVSSGTQRIVIGDHQQEVDIIPVGPPGPAGPPGDAGPRSFEYIQINPNTVWTITHDLGHHPGGITVLDENGDLVLGWTATHASMNILILTFPSAVSGTAYIS